LEPFKATNFPLERVIHPSTKELKALTNEAFALDDYCSNFPQIFSPLSPYNVRAYKDPLTSHLAALVVFKPFYFYDHHKLFTSYGIGSVAISKRHQNKGLGSEILKSLLFELTKEPIDFIFLFSEKRTLYENLGFSKVHEAFTLDLQTLRLKELKKDVMAYMGKEKNQSSFLLEEGKTFEKIEAQTLNEEALISLWTFILKCPSLGSVEPFLSFLEFKSLMTIPNLKIFLLKKEKRLLALHFFEKGDDFPSMHHGFYASSLENLSLHLCFLQTFFKDQKTSLFLTPCEKQALQEIALNPFFSPYSSFYIYEQKPSMKRLFEEGKLTLRAFQSI
jgi:N-acetylglutamate synthase-like GNAT family acetyltransferase